MAMNKKGQARTIVGIMYAITIFIAVVVMISPIKTFIDIARNTEHLGCEYTNNTVGVQGTCILVDWYLPYFFGTCVFAALGYIIYRKTADTGQ